MIDNLAEKKAEVLENMRKIANNRKAKKSDRTSAARIWLNYADKMETPDDTGAQEARRILESVGEI